MPTQNRSGCRSVAPSPTTCSPPEQSSQAAARTMPLGRKVYPSRHSQRGVSSDRGRVSTASRNSGGDEDEDEDAPPRKRRALGHAARPVGSSKSVRDVSSIFPPSYPSRRYRTSSRVTAPTRSRHSGPGPITVSQPHSPVVPSSPRGHHFDKAPMLARFIGEADEDKPVIEDEDEELEVKCPFPPRLPYTWPVIIPEDAPGIDQENYIEEMQQQLLSMLEYVEYYMQETEFVGMSSQRDVKRAGTHLKREEDKLCRAVRNVAQASGKQVDFIDWFTYETESMYERLLKDRDSCSDDDEEQAINEPQAGNAGEAEDVDSGAEADNESDTSSSGGYSVGKRHRADMEPVIREVFRLKQAELREQLICLDSMEHGGGSDSDSSDDGVGIGSTNELMGPSPLPRRPRNYGPEYQFVEMRPIVVDPSPVAGPSQPAPLTGPNTGPHTQPSAISSSGPPPDVYPSEELYADDLDDAPMEDVFGERYSNLAPQAGPIFWQPSRPAIGHLVHGSRTTGDTGYLGTPYGFNHSLPTEGPSGYIRPPERDAGDELEEDELENDSGTLPSLEDAVARDERRRQQSSSVVGDDVLHPESEDGHTDVDLYLQFSPVDLLPIDDIYLDHNGEERWPNMRGNPYGISDGDEITNGVILSRRIPRCDVDGFLLPIPGVPQSSSADRKS